LNLLASLQRLLPQSTRLGLEPGPIWAIADELGDGFRLGRLARQSAPILAIRVRH